MKRPLKLQIPEIIEPIYQPMRYKILHGGRGGCKSYGFADASIVRCIQSKTRILCTREIQGSIKDSVHRLLCDRIDFLNVNDAFRITNDSIVGVNGSNYLFKGLHRNSTEIKSTEGVDISWTEEAEDVSKDSWDVLTPTIRKDGSEIWVSFNPKRKNSATYQKWIINTPPESLKLAVNYWDNPWFPEVLRKEMEYDKKNDYPLYLQKWCGQPVGLGGKIYAKFNEKAHVREFDRAEMIKRGNHFMAIDPHSKYYPAILFIAIFPKNERKKWPDDFHKHIYDEYPRVSDMDGPYHELRHKVRYDGTLKQLATSIYAREGIGEGIKILKRFVDTRYAKGAGGRTMTTIGLVEEWAKEQNGSISLEMPAEKFIDIQRDIIQSDLDYNVHTPVSQFNEPNLTISPVCKNLIYSMNNHSLEEDKEKEDEEYKDFSDALRIMYAGLTDYEYKDPSLVSNEKYIHRFGGGGGWMG